MTNNARRNQDIIVKTTKILAGKDIEVVNEGFAPRVEYDIKTKMPVRVVLPAIPDTASKELINAIAGYVDHEVSHILHSDGDDIADTSKNKLWHFIHNCIDDPRVNRLMGKKYPGCVGNIHRGYKYLYDGHKRQEMLTGSPPPGADPYSEAAIDAVDFTDADMVKKYQANYCFMWFANRMGCQYVGPKYSEMKLDRLFDRLEAKMDADKVRSLSRVETASDVARATEYFYNFFEREFNEEDCEAQGRGKGTGEGEGKEGNGQPKKVIGKYDNEFKTFEERLQEDILLDLQVQACKAKKGIYWTDRWDENLDKHGILKNYSRPVDLERFENEVRTVTNYLQKDLLRLLEERKRQYYIGGYKSGKLNTKSLWSAKVGNDRIFKKKNEIRALNACVSLVCDLSGSMSGSRAKIAMQSAYAFSLVMTQLKIPFEVFGFTTQSGNYQMRDAYEQFAKTINSETRKLIVNEGCPEMFYQFKRFEDNFDIFSKQAMAIAAYSGVSMIQNEDSKHVVNAMKRLSFRPEANKVLFVFSDGQPAYPTRNIVNGDPVGRHNLKYYCHNSMEEFGVKTYGIGIQSDAVKHFYPKNKVIQELNELPKALFEFLKQSI